MDCSYLPHQSMMKNLYLALCLFALCKGLSAGVFPKLVPISFTSCEEIPGQVNIEVKKEANKDEISWSGNLTIPMLVDPNTEFKAEVRAWKNNEWEKKAHSIKGKLCFYLQKFGSKIWDDLRKKSKPPIVDCPIKPNTYVYENVVNDYSSLKIPGMQKGKWKGKIQLGKEKPFCGVVEIEMV